MLIAIENWDTPHLFKSETWYAHKRGMLRGEVAERDTSPWAQPLVRHYSALDPATYRSWGYMGNPVLVYITAWKVAEC